MARSRAGGRRLSQADVAKHAGVSPGVVSAVVNDRFDGLIRISDATRDRVRTAIRELGYIPNVAARNLARGSSRLLGVFTYDQLFPVTPLNFYHEFLVGIEEAADTAEYNLLLLTGLRDADNRRSIYAAGGNSLQLADGALFLGTHEKLDEIARLTDEGYPFVFVGRREFEGHDVSYVGVDYRSGVEDVVRQAAALGHRRMLMIIRPGSPEFQPPNRRTGFRDGVRTAGLAAGDCPIHSLEEFAEPGREDKSEASGTVNLDALVERVKAGEITAVVAENNGIARAVLERFAAAGVRVPEDVSVVGLHSGGEMVPESLTQLNVPRYQMGQEATRMLLDLIGDPARKPLTKMLACGELGGSTLGPVPRTAAVEQWPGGR